MEANPRKYYFNYRVFIGDEYDGESVISGSIEQGENDVDAERKLRKRIGEEKHGDITAVYCVKLVTKEMDTIYDALFECIGGELTSAQCFNTAFSIIHNRYKKHV